MRINTGGTLTDREQGYQTYYTEELAFLESGDSMDWLKKCMGVVLAHTDIEQYHHLDDKAVRISTPTPTTRRHPVVVWLWWPATPLADCLHTSQEVIGAMLCEMPSSLLRRTQVTYLRRPPPCLGRLYACVRSDESCVRARSLRT
jgi:hypothetical protein